MIYYSVENLDEGAIEQRGIAGSAGVAFDNLILAPNTRYRVWLLEAATLRVAEVEITTPDPGFRFTFPDFLFRTASAHDADGDGLHDLGESILGTDGLDPDSDNDGILDGPEVRQGLDPVSGLAVRTGLIGSVDTVGDALDVCAANDIAVVALGSLGVRVFNIFNGMNPVLIASVDTPGDARAVAASGSRIAVADGPAGLAVIDISDPPAASIVHRVNLGASTRAVAVAGDVAFVGLDSGEVVSVDLGSGIILDRLQLDAIPEDLGVGGEHLYAWTDGVLYTLSFQEGELAVVDTLAATGGIGPGGRRLRLFVGSDLAYGIYKSGYSIFDLTDSAHPTLNQTVATGQLGWKQIVANGSGLGVAAVSPNATDDGTHHVSLFNVGADGTGSDFVTEFETPGLAAAVTIYNGIAYIADSEAGLQVLNYLAYDSDGVPPTIQLSSNLTNDEAEEGKSIRVTAEVQDDVQVRNVEFYVDGVKAATDGNYPFQFRTLAPLQSEQSSLAIRARASDTGGNATFSDDLEIAVALDATPPQVVSHNPSDGAFLDPLPGLAVFLSEPIDPASIGASTIQLIEAGPDGVFGNNDDVEVTGGTFNYHENRNAVSYTLPEVLPPGSYEARLTMDLRDPAGNQLLEDFTWRFYSPVISGQWDFDDGDLRATVGIDMEFADGVGGATDIATRFGGTDTLGVSNIDGSVAEVMEFPKATPGMGTLLHTGLDPNGGGNLVNQYTLIMDVMFPAASSGKVRGLFSTDNQGDFDFFASAANGIGANGTFHGVLAPGTWHRVAVAVDLGANTMSKFIDGDLVGEQALDGIDGRWALQPAGQAEDHLILFSDDNGESELGYVNSIQLHNARLPDAVIEAYGGPTAAPIPTDLPPRIVRVSPEPEGTIESLDTVLVYFSEPLNEASLSVDTVQVFAAGADRELGTGDDERIPAAFSHYDPLLLSIEVQLERTLSAGGYEGRVQPGVEDLNGNAAANEFEWRFTVGIAIVQDAVIDAGNERFEGKNIILGDGSTPITVTINGGHQFGSLLVRDQVRVIHSDTDVAETYSMDLQVSGDLTIEAGATFDVNGKGYLGGRRGGNISERGRTVGNTTAGGSAFNAGGSHGGLGGGGSDGAVGAVYDDLLDPDEPGAGGGAHRPGDPGGDGGGLIRLSVGGNLLNNGVITANGSSVGGFFGAGGGGGGIKLDVGTLSGNGTIRANGGDAGTASAGIAMGGGGGGRIAVHYGSNEFTGQFEAHGGSGMHGGFDGGAGTIFVKDKDEASGRLTLDNGGKAPEVASTPLPDAPTELISLHLLNGARPRSNAQANNVISEQLLLDGARTHYRIDGQHRLQTASLVLQNGATLAQVQTTTDAVHRIELTVTGDLTIDATSQINVSGAGYLGGRQGGNNSERGRTTGNTTAGGSAFNAGGSHGGLGGSGSDGAVGAVYDDLLDPEEPGAGGGAHRPGDPGGDGGGLIRLSVSGNLLNNGVINANGSGVGGFFGAGGAGGGIMLDVGTLSGNGTIRANGGDAGSPSAGIAMGGGGGGRIAVHYGSNEFTGQFEAHGGAGMIGGFDGGAGTIFVKDKDEASGRLTLDNGGKAPEVASTPLPDAPTELISLHLLNGARPRSNAQANNVISEQLLLDGARTHYRIDGQYRLQTASLVLQNGATLAQVQTTTDTVHRIELTVTGDLTIDATSQINVSGAGYLGGRQGGNNSERGRTTGNTTAGGSAFNAGGSHGGLGGGGSEGAVGAVYDDLLDPEEPGAGGGAHRPGDPGGDGGGLIRLSVSGNLLNNGVINANGSGVGGFFGAGGAGGGIKLDVGALSGNGTIRANGGDAGTASAGTALGGGGGGRIAVFYETNDFTGKIDAQGGSGMHGGANGAAGTIVLQEKS